MGGVCVAIRMPATSTSLRFHRSRRLLAGVTPSSSSIGRYASMRCWVASMSSTRSSTFARCAGVRSAFPRGTRCRSSTSKSSWFCGSDFAGRFAVSSRTRATTSPRVGSGRGLPVPAKLSASASALKLSSAPTSARRCMSALLGRARMYTSVMPEYGWPASNRTISGSLMPCTSRSDRRTPSVLPGRRSTRYSSTLAFTSSGRIGTPSRRASESNSRRGYMPGSCVSRPAMNSAG